MKRPSFQFYPADWRSNAKLRRCCEAARGAWMDILGLLHDAEEYGMLRWPLADIANAAGVKLKLAKELAEKGVLKGADRGQVKYVYTPRHAGKDGEPVILVDAEGPCWFSSRFVRDEWLRSRRGQATQFTVDNQPPKAAPHDTPKPTPIPPIGERQGDGTTASSPSPISEAKASSIKSRARKRGDEPPGFAEFYDAFPVHKARPKAAIAYASALERTTAEQLLDGARKYARERANEDQKFTSHPATWLNQDRWLDQPTPPSTGGRHGGRENKPAQQSALSAISEAFTERNSDGSGHDFPGGAQLIGPANSSDPN